MICLEPGAREVCKGYTYLPCRHILTSRSSILDYGGRILR